MKKLIAIVFVGAALLTLLAIGNAQIGPAPTSGVFPNPSNAPSITFSPNGATNTGIGGNGGNFVSLFVAGIEDFRADNGIIYLAVNSQYSQDILLNGGRINYVPSSLVLSNGLNSNISLGGSYGRITGPSGAFSVGGLTAARDGGQLDIFNTTSQAMTIVNEDASSTAANRITTLTGANIVLAASVSSAHFIYDNSNARWILLSARDSSGPK